jgi:hypothetical protein
MTLCDRLSDVNCKLMSVYGATYNVPRGHTCGVSCPQARRQLYACTMQHTSSQKTKL